MLNKKTPIEVFMVLIISGAVIYSIYDTTVKTRTIPKSSPSPTLLSPTRSALATYIQTWKYPFPGALGGIIEDPQSGHVMEAHKFFLVDSENSIAELIPDYNLFRRWAIPTPNCGAFFGLSITNLRRVFFTESKAGKIGMLDEPRNLFVEWDVPDTSHNESEPYDVVVGGVAGPVYFTDRGGDRIGQLSLRDNGIVLWSLPKGRNPSGITVCREQVFLLEDGNRIARLDPTTNVLAEWTAPASFGSWSNYIAASQGFLFVTSKDGNKIGRLNPSLNLFTQWTVPTADAEPRDIIVDPVDPSLRMYFAESKSGKIGLVNTFSGSTNTTLSPITRVLNSTTTIVSMVTTTPTYDEKKVSSSTFMVRGVQNNSFIEWSLPVPEVGLEALAPSMFRLVFTHNSGIVGRFQTIVKTVTEYELPPNCRPHGLSVRFVASGNIFFTEENNKVACLNYRENSLREWALSSAEARPFALPPWYSGETRGLIFFTEEGANKIASLNPDTNILKEWDVPTPESRPRGIAFSRNVLYFAEFGANKIGALNLTTDTFTEWNIPTDFSRTSHIELWRSGIAFTESYANRIGYLDLQSNTIEEWDIPTSDSFPTELTGSESGHLYFAENGSNKIGRLRKYRGRTVFEEWSIPILNQSASVSVTSIVRQVRNVFFLDGAGNKIGFHDPALDVPLSKTLVEPVVTNANSTTRTVTPVETLVTPEISVVTSNWTAVIGEVSSKRTPIEQAPDGFVKWPIPTTESKPLKILNTDGFGVFFTESNTNKIGRLGGSWF